MRSLFSNFNSRLLAIHFIAFWFFIYAFQTLGFLHDYKFLFMIQERVNRLNFPDRFNADMIFIQQAGNIGLLAAYVISWTISTNRNWHWINSVFIFLLAFVIKNFVLVKWSSYNNVFMSPGGVFKVYSIWGHVAIGLIAIAVGLVIFFSKALIRYIEKNSATDKKSTNNKKVNAKGVRR
jgi:hypothetical protein